MRLDQTDPLTGLPNRDGAFEYLAQALSQAEPNVAVLLCEVDGLKSINLTRGNAAGDVLLRAITQHLTDAALPGDLVARVSGDEFLLVSSHDSQDSIEGRTQRVLDLFRDGLLGDSGPLPVTLTIGVALADDGTTVSTLIRNASAALRMAKHGGGGFLTYRADLQDAADDERALATDLREAIRAADLTVAYQPVLDVVTGRITGTEALVRWTHPTRGPVNPEVFVPLAERLGLIDDLGTVVLQAALRQQRTWLDDLGENAPDFVAVNISANQVVHADFAETVQTALRETGVPASALTLEVTETALMTDLDSAISTLDALAALGITLDIDDFGTGYSSLAYLTRLPAHAVKIDKSFIERLPEDPKMTATVSAVIGLAKALNLHIVAEGVETAEHLNWLRARGCDLIQGYYVSAPLAADDLADLVTSGRRW